MCNLKLLSFAFILIISINPKALANASVSCPTDPTMAAVSGWVGTPKPGEFIKSYVGNTAGTKTLICRYVANQQGFSIKRAPPKETPVCHPVDAGFSCKSKYYTSYVIKRGVLTIARSLQSDLDAAATGKVGENDLWFDFITPNLSYLRPVNGATFGIYEGDKTINKNECARTKLSSERIAVSTLQSGVVLCVKSGTGRISTLQLDEASASPAGALALSYVTWK